MTGWAVVVALALGASASSEASGRPLYSELRTPPPVPTVASSLPDLTRLAKEATAAVVGVITLQSTPSTTDDALKDLLDKLHDGPRKGIGSGFVIHKDGWII